MVFLFLLFGLVLSPAGSLPVAPPDGDLPPSMVIPKDSSKSSEEVPSFNLTELSDANELVETFTMNRELQEEDVTPTINETTEKGLLVLEKFFANINFRINSILPYLEKKESDPKNATSPSEDKLDSFNNETTEGGVVPEDFTTTPSTILEDDDPVDYEIIAVVTAFRLMDIVIYEVGRLIDEMKPYEDELDFSKAAIVLDMYSNGTVSELNSNISDPAILGFVTRRTDYHLQVQKEIMRAVITLLKPTGLFEPFKGLPPVKKPEIKEHPFEVGLLVPYLKKNETVGSAGTLNSDNDDETSGKEVLKNSTTASKSVLGNSEFFDHEEAMVKKTLKTVIDHVDLFLNENKHNEDTLNFSEMSIILEIDGNDRIMKLPEISDPKLLDHIIRNTDFDVRLQKEIMKAVLALKKAMDLPEPIMQYLRKLNWPRHQIISFKIGFIVPYFGNRGTKVFL